jgi:hypothetical protein
MSTNGMNIRNKRHYWDREDFDMLLGVVDRDPHPDPVHEAASATCLNYPKSIEGAYRELRLRGLECDEGDLKLMVTDAIVRPDGIEHPEDDLGKQRWEKHHIDAAADWLYEHRRWSSWTHYCYVNNLRYGQCVKAYRAACIRYGFPVTWTFDVQGINQTVEAPANHEDFAYVRFYPQGTELGPVGETE